MCSRRRRRRPSRSSWRHSIGMCVRPMRATGLPRPNDPAAATGRGRIVLMPNKLPSLGGIGWSSPLVSIEDDWDMGYLTPADAVERKWHSVRHVAGRGPHNHRQDHDQLRVGQRRRRAAAVAHRHLESSIAAGGSTPPRRRRGGPQPGVVLVDFVDGATSVVQQLVSCNRFAARLDALVIGSPTERMALIGYRLRKVVGTSESLAGAARRVRRPARPRRWRATPVATPGR